MKRWKAPRSTFWKNNAFGAQNIPSERRQGSAARNRQAKSTLARRRRSAYFGAALGANRTDQGWDWEAFRRGANAICMDG